MIKSPAYTNATVVMIALLCGAFCGSTHAAEQSIGVPHDIYAEGTYYGAETVTFSLAVAGDNFIKTYSNGTVVAGEKKNGEAVYYFINKNNRLITKVSQENLYRIGEFTNWNNMIGLINLKPGAILVKENKMDRQDACTFYSVENEGKTRACMDDNCHLPVYIEQNGRVIERTSHISPYRSPLDPAALIAEYLRGNYRFIDADDDISPDSD
ncbi:MAG: hypothetical protein HQL09_02660 [Nitrospirae bacterium]|nr:hypothetical protein [Nitrospirota bacterium]